MANVLNTTEPDELDSPMSSAIPDVQSDQSTKPPTEPHMGQLQPPKRQHLVRVIGVPLVLVLLLAGAVLSLWLVRSASDGSSSNNTNSAVTTITAADTRQSLAVLAVTNPGFEEGLDGWVSGYARWEDKPNTNYKVLLDSETAHQGQASAYILPDWKYSLPSNSGVISRKMAADGLRGKKVRYSGYVKADDVTRAGLWLEVHGTMEIPGVEGGVRSNRYFLLRYEGTSGSDSDIKGTVDWRRHELVVDVPQEAEFILFGLSTWADLGRAWLDDVQLEIVGDDVALTCRGNETMTGNSDFENGLHPWRYDVYSHRRDQWPDLYVYHIGTSREAAYEGEQGAYIRVEKPASELDEFDGLGVNIDQACLRGRKVTVSLYINADAVNGRAILWAQATYAILEKGVDLDTSDKNHAESDFVAKEITIWPPPDAKGDAKIGWQRQEITLDVPYTAGNFHVGIRLYGEGEIWIDNVKVDAR